MENNELIKPEDIINRYTLKEIHEFANDYFKDREDHLYLYQKPFFHPKDSPSLIINLGELLSGLNLETGMRVLDFGAGSCWLSKILVQLGCKVTACDISARALDIGKKLFEKYPPITIQNHEDDIEFLVYDGITIDKPDNYYDRIIVNDAFHHMVDYKKILSEFYRILKPSGIVGMSEPGREHSSTEASQYEMKTFNVLERDFLIEEIWQLAKLSGFNKILIFPVLRNIFLSFDEYLNIVKGIFPKSLLINVMQYTTNHSIFFLHKIQDNEKGRDHQKEFFDEAYYLSIYTDVAEAVRRGEFKSAWHHYILYGHTEGRKTCP